MCEGAKQFLKRNWPLIAVLVKLAISSGDVGSDWWTGAQFFFLETLPFYPIELFREKTFYLPLPSPSLTIYIRFDIDRLDISFAGITLKGDSEQSSLDCLRGLFELKENNKEDRTISNPRGAVPSQNYTDNSTNLRNTSLQLDKDARNFTGSLSLPLNASLAPDVVTPNHPIWSFLTFAIMFAPGLVFGIFLILSLGFTSLEDSCPLYKCPKWFIAMVWFFFLCLVFVFPFGVLGIQLFEFFVLLVQKHSKSLATDNGGDDMKKTLNFISETTTALEAFFESAFQISLQIYIIWATKEASGTQLASIGFSIIMLAKATIVYDLTYTKGSTDRPFWRTLIYIASVLPVYACSTVFKIGAISISAMLFGHFMWMVLVGAVVFNLFIARRMQYKPLDAVILSLTNLTVVSNKNA